MATGIVKMKLVGGSLMMDNARVRIVERLGAMPQEYGRHNVGRA
jgi:hypothetical protein